MLPTGDTNYCSREQRKPCKYIISGQPCPFGRRCRYEHSLHASDANGTFCNQGGSSGEVSRVSAVSQTRDTPLLDFVSFPTLKNSASRAAVLVPSAPLASSSTVDKRPIAGRQRPFVRESGGPPELTLEQFFNKAISLQPRQAVVRPTPRQSGEGLRDVELQQMKARFPEDQCQLVERSRDKDVYRLKFSPLDPQWVCHLGPPMGNPPLDPPMGMPPWTPNTLDPQWVCPLGPPMGMSPWTPNGYVTLDPPMGMSPWTPQWVCHLGPPMGNPPLGPPNGYAPLDPQ